MTRTALLVSLSLVLSGLFIYQPFLGLIAGFLAPLPMALAGYLYGPSVLSTGLVVFCLLVQIFYGPVALVALLPQMVLGFVLGAGFNRRLPVSRILVAGSLVLGALMMLVLQAGSSVAGKSAPMQEMQTSVQAGIQNRFLAPLTLEEDKASLELQNLLSQVPVISQKVDEQKARVQDLKSRLAQAKEFERQVNLVFENPFAMLFFFQFVLLAFSIRVFGYIIDRLGFVPIPRLGFLGWQCPPAVSMWLVSLMLCYLLLRAGEGPLPGWFISISIGMQFMYFVVGFSLVCHMAQRFALPSMGRWIFYLLGLVFAQVVMVVGFIDSFLNIRESRSKE